jgi:transcriptional regulator with AAA-type ATPase domain/tetratricopeptide (TPR) repeat protein
MEDLRVAIRRLAERARATRSLPSVLILGETGTGKGLVAKVLHRLGPRATGPLVDLNCASIPESLLESELFGAERGAFTGATTARRGVFQVAHGGTLFLDEIGLLSPGLQAKLLKAVEDRTVRRLGSTRAEPLDVWIISATNESLADAVQQGKFREDLYHRLAVVTLRLPPLREREGDAVLLARQFLARAATDYRLGEVTLTAAAEARIAAHPWPGNVRELANTIDRAALLSESSTIEEAALELGPRPPPRGEPTPASRGAGVLRARTDRSPAPLASALREHLQAALDRHRGNITRAAESLGIARNTLRAHIRRLGMTAGRAGPPRPDPLPPGPPAALRPPPPGSAGREAGRRAGPGPPPPASEGTAPAAMAGPPGLGRDAPRPAFRWERQLLTFVAIGLTPPAGASEFQLTPVLQDLVMLLERFGGRVDAIAPLRIEATFGAEPVEDAPRRAAAALVATLKALERDPRGVLARGALEVAEHLVIRAGAVTGVDPAARQATRLAIDDLLASAAPAEILVGVAALPHLDRSFELAPRSGLTRQGHPAHRLLPRERSGLLVGGHRPSPFVGRASELAMLHEVLERAERGQGQIVGITGEPGVGKSRLLSEFRLALGPERARVLFGRCVSYGGAIPYLPIVDVVHQACGLADGDDIDTAAAKLDRAVRAAGLDPSTSVPYLLHLLGWKQGTESLANVSPEAVRQRMLDTLERLVRSASRTKPTVCAIEDLQWVDPSSEEALSRLVDGLGGSAVLVLVTHRPGYRPPWLGRSYAHQLALRRLNASESRAVLAAHLREADLSAEVADRLIDQADGIPFHLEELARAFADVRHVAVPPTLQGVLAARLGRLESGARELLQAAAVIGREFSSALLAEMVGRSVPDLDTALAGLQAAEFVAETRERPARTYRFRHALTQDVAYRTLLDLDRQTLHARVAAAIEAGEPDTAERRPEILARHYTEGGRPERAIPYWARAARLALGRSALVEAVAHLRQGLQLVPALGETPERMRSELTMQLDLGTALAAQGGYAVAEVAEPLARARALADRLGDARELFPVRWALWRFAFSRADYGTARALASQFREAATGPGGEELRTAAELAVGAVHFYLGEFAAAELAFEAAWQAHSPARAQRQILLCGQDLGAAARAFQAWGQAIRGEATRAARTGNDALDAARATGHPFSLGLALYLVAWAAWLRGDASQVRALGAELVELAERYSFKLLTAFGLMVNGWAARATGDLAEAVTVITRGAELFRAVGQRAGLFHRAILAETLLAAGEVDRGEDVLRDALAQAEATGEQAFVAELDRLRGDARARRADVDAAEACYRRALELAPRQGAWLLALRAGISGVQLARPAGAGPTAAGERLGQLLRQVPRTVDAAELEVARALLGEASRDPAWEQSQTP